MGVMRRAVTSDVTTYVVAFLAFFGLVVFDSVMPSPSTVTSSRVSPEARRIRRNVPRVVTLDMGDGQDVDSVLHNCVQAARAGAQMDVHTSNIGARYCNVCRCLSHAAAGCAAANRTEHSVRQCEKAAFLARATPALRELIYLDADVIVMTPRFFTMLAARATVHDFLASYVHESYAELPQYYGVFSPGVLFVRHKRGASYLALLPRLHKYEERAHRAVLSGWVFDTYANWDSLSWKWHCRGLLRFRQNTPPAACLSIHDREEAPALLKLLNYTLLTSV